MPRPLPSQSEVSGVPGHRKAAGLHCICCWVSLPPPRRKRAALPHIVLEMSMGLRPSVPLARVPWMPTGCPHWPCSPHLFWAGQMGAQALTLVTLAWHPPSFSPRHVHPGM